MIMVANPKDAAAFPSPLTYDAHDRGVQPNKKLTKVMGGVNYKDMKKLRKEKHQENKEKQAEERERAKDLADKLAGKIPKYPEPIPQGYQTFDKWRTYWNKNKPKPKEKDGKIRFIFSSWVWEGCQVHYE